MCLFTPQFILRLERKRCQASSRLSIPSVSSMIHYAHCSCRKGEEKTMTNHLDELDNIGQKAIEYLGLKHAARERALPKSRTAIRYCANSIRATHRQEFQHAGELLAQAAVLLAEMAEDLRDHQDIFYAGFVQDAQKELAEAAAFLALAQNLPLPEAQTLSIGWAPYLNGVGVTVGELRRYVLDQLRRGNSDQG